MEIDGVLLTSMSTKELSAHARARGIPPLQSRAAFLNALADALANEEENVGDVHNVETMVTTKTTTRVTYAARRVGVKEGEAKIGGQTNVDVEDDEAEAVDATEENYMDRDDMEDGKRGFCLGRRSVHVRRFGARGRVRDKHLSLER